MRKTLQALLFLALGCSGAGAATNGDAEPDSADGAETGVDASLRDAANPDSSSDGGAGADAGDAALVPGALELTIIPVNLSWYSLTFDGEAFAAAWTAMPVDAPRQLHFARIDTDGVTLVEPTPLPISEDVRPRVNIVSITGGYVVFHWDSDTRVRAVRLDATGAVLGEEVTDLRLYPWSAEGTMRSNGSSIAVAQRGSGACMNVTIYGMDMVPRAPSTLLEDVCWDPRIVSTPGGYDVLWTTESHRVGVARFDDQGAMIGTPSTLFDEGRSQALRAVVRIGQARFLAWEDGTDEIVHETHFLYRTDAGGGWAESAELIARGRRSEPRPGMVALADGTVVVAWRDDSVTALPQLHVGSIRLAANETAVRGIETLSDGRFPVGGPVLASNGDRVAVLFSATARGSEHLLLVLRP